MLLEQLPGGAGGLGGHQRVEDDPAGLAADEGDVGEVEAADLVDAGDHLVEAVVVVELRDGGAARGGCCRSPPAGRGTGSAAMSQATWPASAMIFISVIGAMRPLRLLVEVAACRRRAAAACALPSSDREGECGDGALPLGWKCPASGAGAGWARAAPLSKRASPATAKAAPAAGIAAMNSRLVAMAGFPRVWWRPCALKTKAQLRLPRSDIDTGRGALTTEPPVGPGRRRRVLRGRALPAARRLWRS